MNIQNITQLITDRRCSRQALRRLPCPGKAGKPSVNAFSGIRHGSVPSLRMPQSARPTAIFCLLNHRTYQSLQKIKKWAKAHFSILLSVMVGNFTTIYKQAMQAIFTARRDWHGRRRKWSGRPGSNRRRPAWEADILPLNYARSWPVTFIQHALFCQGIFRQMDRG